jgi:ribosomal protein S18 acetylase RimI-like enzyme
MMRIREVVPEDRIDLLRILEATGVFQDYEIVVADEVLRDSLLPASGYHSRCCVTEADRPVGYVCWGPTPCTSGTYDLYWIAVHPEYQGHGVGKLLLNHAEEQVRQESARLMIIETSSINDYEATRKFYSQNGYQQYAIIPDFYRQGDHKIIYGKNFVS